MLEIDGNGARQRQRLIGMLGQGDGELQKAAGPDEVVGKVGAQRIAPPGGAADVLAALAAQGVVHQGDDGSGGGQERKNLVLHRAPQLRGIDPLVLKQAVGRRPVLKLLAGSA